VSDAFMPVFCVLTMQILEGVVSYVTDEGVRVHGASHEEGRPTISAVSKEERKTHEHVRKITRLQRQQSRQTI
jgi:hypothetical protein